jgi:gamma-carbonic anhydrase
MDCRNAREKNPQTTGDMMIIPFGDKTPEIAPTAFVAENATVIGDTVIGANSSIWFGAVVRGDSNWIKIGARTNIQDLCVLHTDDRHSLTIGNDVTVGHRAILHGCVINDRVLIGMGATIMNGAVIGSGSIIGAGALVTESAVIPAGSLVLGVPAKVKRELSSSEIMAVEGASKHYVEFAEIYLSSNR